MFSWVMSWHLVLGKDLLTRGWVRNSFILFCSWLQGNSTFFCSGPHHWKCCNAWQDCEEKEIKKQKDSYLRDSSSVCSRDVLKLKPLGDAVYISVFWHRVVSVSLRSAAVLQDPGQHWLSSANGLEGTWKIWHGKLEPWTGKSGL